jgi:hypothetical protein
MLRLVFVFILLVGLGGCVSMPYSPHPLADGYQFGDLTKSVKRRIQRMALIEQRYCETNKVVIRKFVVEQVRAFVPAYPEEGLCGYYVQSDNLTILPMALSLGALVSGVVLI